MLALIGCLAGLAAAMPAAQRPPIGISTNIKQGGGVADLIREIQTMRSAGCGLMYVSYKWSDLEPRAGSRDLKRVTDGARGLGALGYDIAVTLQTIDTNRVTLPADLQGKPFDAPEVLDRWEALLRAVATQLNRSVKWVLLGNEVDIYLAAHPDALPAYIRFLGRGRAVLKQAAPWLAVGVTCTLTGAQAHPDLFAQLNKGSDVVGITYYPLRPDFAVRPTSEVAADFDAMVRLTAGKPIFVQEAGYPADPLLGSSEDAQAAFVDAVFDATARHADRLACVNFFLLYDFGDTLVDTFVRYYGVGGDRFRAYLATLGLKRADGTPRKAYARFLARVGAWAKAQ